MPKCIDDPSRSYTGNEPSPKGLGYCAHTQAVGTTKTGNDGNTWTVETTYKGTKRWVKKSGSSKRVPKEKKTSSKRKSPKKVSKKKTSGKRKSTKKVSKKKTSGKRKSTKTMTGAGRVEYHRYANADKRWKKKKTSGKRKSTKKVSKKKTSNKRKSPKKVSKKKTSGKRKSPKKVSKKNNDPIVYKNMTLKDLQKRFKKIDKRPKTYEKTENGTYPISWNIGSDLKENEIYTTDLNISFHGNNGQSITSSYTKPSYTLKKSEIRKIVRKIVKEEQKNRNIKKINSVATHFKPFLYRGKPEKGAMIADISIYHS